MRRLLALSLLGIGCLLTASAAGHAGAAGAAPVKVKPRIGSPTSSFEVSFRAPDRSGVSGGIQRQYVVSASGPSRSGRSCVDSASKAAPPSRAHARVNVKLAPPRGKRWCRGTFRGEVDEIESPHCARGVECPQFVVFVKRIGKFTFKVRQDRTPPVFAGLGRAVQCFPGPERPREQRPVGLSWTAATDDFTPRSQIVYVIYMSTTAGGEDFSRPSWTARGTTSFTTPDLSPGRYFVVRARDTAGNEDRNKVERRAENPCV